ncbi:hypothetical protein B1218_37470, partial [Pseudomonas ogarae]
VSWDCCRPKVLVMERIYGTQVTDLATLADHRTDMNILAELRVDTFFPHVFRDSVFLAYRHPPNIFVISLQLWRP